MKKFFCESIGTHSSENAMRAGMTKSCVALVVLCALAVALAACNSKSSASSGSAAITDAARADAKDLFASRCAACHGEQGRGDGPSAGGLNPRPRNFHDSSWQQSVTDEQIEKTILLGGAAVGKSPLMVANPDLQNQPAVVAALREHIRNLGAEK